MYQDHPGKCLGLAAVALIYNIWVIDTVNQSCN